MGEKCSVSDRSKVACQSSLGHLVLFGHEPLQHSCLQIG